MKIEYGTINREFSALPEASQRAIATSGFAHYLGNVVASKVVGLIRQEIAGKDADTKATKAVSTDAIKAFREANADTVKRWTDETQADLLDAMDKGELGTRAVAVRVDPLTAAMNLIAGQRVRAILKKAGLKVPKGDETINIGGNDRTFAQLVERQINHEVHGKVVRAEAERKVKEDARRAKMAEQVEGDLDL